MSVELLYTSAPAGLKPGSRGFCTVLSTAGTPVNLATRLETLSGYRHVFPPPDPQAALNPVAWSHVRVTIAGQPTSILSRVAAYGVDYSGRTNKLAHHLVVQATEAPAAGPAWLLSQPGVMRTTWDGKCQIPPAGPAIPQGDLPAAICHRWQAVTGDAGWGGVVAEALASPAGKPLWIVFSIEQSDQLLGLLTESIALLAPSQKWQATFSSYYTNLPPEIDCKVRCVLEGTDEAKLAAGRGILVDLTQSLAVPPENSFATIARCGNTAQEPKRPLVSGSESSPSFDSTQHDPFAPDDMRLDYSPNSMRSNTGPGARNTFDKASVTFPTLPPSLSDHLTPPSHRTANHHNSTIKAAAVSLAILAICCVVVVGIVVARKSTDVVAENNNPATSGITPRSLKDIDPTSTANRTNTTPGTNGNLESPEKITTKKGEFPDATTKPRTDPGQTAQEVVTPIVSSTPNGMVQIEEPSTGVVGSSATADSSIDQHNADSASLAPELSDKPEHYSHPLPVQKIEHEDIQAAIAINKQNPPSAIINHEKLVESGELEAVFKVDVEISNKPIMVAWNPRESRASSFEKETFDLSSPSRSQILSKDLQIGMRAIATIVIDTANQTCQGTLRIYSDAKFQDAELNRFVKLAKEAQLKMNDLNRYVREAKAPRNYGINIDLPALLGDYLKNESSNDDTLTTFIADTGDVLANYDNELKIKDITQNRKEEIVGQRTSKAHSLKYAQELQIKMLALSLQLSELLKGIDVDLGTLTLYMDSGELQKGGMSFKPPGRTFPLQVFLHLEVGK